jgi:hypothetical protein
MGAMGIGVVAGAAARAFAKPMTMAPEPTRSTPTIIPDDADVVVLDDVRATPHTTTTMPTRDADV